MENNYNCLLWLCVVAFSLTDCRIMEKTELACNGPCGRMWLTCPKDHRVAVRDAVYRVQERDEFCTAFDGCSGIDEQEVCCDPTPQDCIFAFSPPHLRAVQKNCSFAPSCELQTERSEVESVQCSATNPASQTLVNYVCVNESIVADICSPREMVVQGKTLFALLDPRGPGRPRQGSVCTCLAESARWPTTNSVAAFLVDMRLNRLDSEDCANATITVRSGGNQRTLTCATARDPRVNFPFVAVVNDSNVASLQLQLDKHLPEFFWIGFEANEEEDIRLSCKMQGVQPTGPGNGQQGPSRPPGQTDTPGSGTGQGSSGANGGFEQGSTATELGPKQTKKKKLPMAAVIGGAVAAGVVTIIVVIIIGIYATKKWRKARSSREAEESENDLDYYYSTTSDELRKRDSQKTSVEKKSSSRRSNDSTQELYISADQVRANKPRSNSSKRVRIISTPDIVEDLGPEEYVSARQVRENKRMSQKKKQSSAMKKSVDQKHPSNPGFKSSVSTDDEDDHYDRLNKPPPKNMADILESYDQLEPGGNSGSPEEAVGVQRSDSRRPLVGKGGESMEHGCVNGAYEDTETDVTKRKTGGGAAGPFRLSPVTITKGGTEDRGVYFELEKDNSARNSAASIASTNNVYDQCKPEQSGDAAVNRLSTDSQAEPASQPSQGSGTTSSEAATLPIRRVSLGIFSDSLASGGEELREEDEEIYNDGKSDPPSCSSNRRMSNPAVNSKLSVSPKPDKRSRGRSSVAGLELGMPRAAPRRTLSKDTLGAASFNYDIAKPIQ